MSSRADELYKKGMGHAKALFFKDYDKAYECFVSAAAQYKLEKQYRQAGEAYMRAGDAAVKNKDNMQASQAYVDSANCYKKVDVKEAGLMLQIAIQMCIDQNRLGQAARLEKDFAEALDGDGERDGAVQHFQQAYNYFIAEDQPQSAMQCKVKMAKILGEQDKFEQCVKLYEEIGTSYAEGPLKHQAKEYFVRAMLCRLALVGNDNRGEKSSECAEAFDSYQAIDPNLKHTREANFVQAMIEAVQDNDLEKFDDAVQELNELRLLDDWKTHVLLVMKKNFEDLT